ncbi:MAG: ABC transporter permease [Betaproteobacteria bacterium]|nr:ABC transporter permease [Betaproteobacteria bacterium]
MPFLPVPLGTDVLVYLLLAVVVGFAWYVRRHEHLRLPWLRVARTPAAMSALVPLVVFLLIGFLDSLHFRPALPAAPGAQAQNAPAAKGVAYAVDVKSVLDVLLDSLASKTERTYSAPLATHAFAKETVEVRGEGGKAGRQIRDYPRLQYGGTHLLNPERDWQADVLLTLFRGVALAVPLWLALSLFLVAACSGNENAASRNYWRAVWAGKTEMPWRAILIALGLLLAVVLPVILLSRHYHVLGTDKVGQDVLYLSLKSVRTALVIGTLTTLVMLPFAVLFGIMAGYLRGWVDDVIQYLYTTLNSIPGVLLIAAAVLVLQVYIENHPDLFPTAAERADFRLLFLCLILGITSWTGLCRLLRGEALKLRELEYVQAAQAFGVSEWRIMLRHILPNVMHIVMISVVMDFSGLVLAEAVLSYVGVGVDPSMNSFGTMINAARMEMGREPMVWWSLASAFIFMLALVLAANLFADAVRDAFDPRVRVGARPVFAPVLSLNKAA